MSIVDQIVNFYIWHRRDPVSAVEEAFFSLSTGLRLKNSDIVLQSDEFDAGDASKGGAGSLPRYIAAFRFNIFYFFVYICFLFVQGTNEASIVAKNAPQIFKQKINSCIQALVNDYNRIERTIIRAYILQYKPMINRWLFHV